MRGRSHRWALAVLGTAAALFACNQIIGVDDVKLSNEARSLDKDGSIQPVGDDDADIVTPTAEGGGPVPDPHPTLALGFSHTCARMLDSTVRCWGSNFTGELGDGVSLDASAPTPQDVLRPENIKSITDAVAIAAGTSHTCVIHKGGKMSCWGDNFAGSLGNGNTDPSSTPVDVVGVTDALTVAGGGGVTCITHQDNTASCWGANSNGGLGDGTTTDASKPVKVKDLTNVAQIAPSTNATCAVTTTGDVYCWGAGSDGQLGTGSLLDTPKPTKLTALSGIAQVAVASRFACARAISGSVFCWGRNDTGQLGNGSPSDAPNPSPIAVPFITDAAFLWGGYGHVCAARKTGGVMCWGDGTSGQLGIGPVDAAGTSQTTPIAVPGVMTAKAVYTGGDRTCIITSDNKALCWGANREGQLGIGSTDDQDKPVAVSDFP